MSSLQYRSQCFIRAIDDLASQTALQEVTLEMMPLDLLIENLGYAGNIFLRKDREIKRMRASSVVVIVFSLLVASSCKSNELIVPTRSTTETAIVVDPHPDWPSGAVASISGSFYWFRISNFTNIEQYRLTNERPELVRTIATSVELDRIEDIGVLDEELVFVGRRGPFIEVLSTLHGRFRATFGITQWPTIIDLDDNRVIVRDTQDLFLVNSDGSVERHKVPLNTYGCKVGSTLLLNPDRQLARIDPTSFEQVVFPDVRGAVLSIGCTNSRGYFVERLDAGISKLRWNENASQTVSRNYVSMRGIPAWRVSPGKETLAVWNIDADFLFVVDDDSVERVRVGNDQVNNVLASDGFILIVNKSGYRILQVIDNGENPID